MNCPYCGIKAYRHKIRENTVQFKCTDCSKYFSVKKEDVQEELTPKNSDLSVQIQEDLNSVDINFKIKGARTVGQFRKDWGFPEDKWALVGKFEAGEWDMFMKVNNEPLTIPLYSGRAKFEKIIPEKVCMPHVHPVNIQINKNSLGVKSKNVDTDKTLVIPDLHVGFRRDIHTNVLTPFHDRKLLSIILQVVKENNFNKIVVLGDALDMNDWSDKFIREPEFYFTTQPAIYELSWFLGKLRQYASERTEIHFIGGNHEDSRFKRAVINNLNAAYQLTRLNEQTSMYTIEYMLGLKGLNISYYGDYPKGIYETELVDYKHGNVVKKDSGMTVAAVLKDNLKSYVFGHIHRAELAWKTIFIGNNSKVIFAMSAGCLCKIDDTLPAGGINHNWQNAFGTIENNHPYLHVFQNNNSITYNHTEYKEQEKEYLRMLKDETNYGF